MMKVLFLVTSWTIAVLGAHGCASYVPRSTVAELKTDSDEYVVNRQIHQRNQSLVVSMRSILKNAGSQTLFVRRQCDHDSTPAYRFERVDRAALEPILFQQVCALSGGVPPIALPPGDSLVRTIQLAALLPLSTSEQEISRLEGDYRLIFTVQTESDTLSPPTNLIPLQYRSSKPVKFRLSRPQ